MAGTTFGEHLRREREMRGVSLEEISAATRIATRFLQALEDEHWDRLPGGVFNRGFVRAVARYLGLSEEEMVAEYTLATNERLQAASGSPPAAVPGPKKRSRMWLVALIAVVLALSSWFAWRRLVSRPFELTPTSAKSGAEAVPTPRDTLITAEPALHLSVAAARPTFITVVADGKSVFDGQMTPGENQSFQAQEGFEVSARDSSAVLLELNGQAVPPGGLLGRAGKVTLTRKNLKDPAGGPH